MILVIFHDKCLDGFTSAFIYVYLEFLKNNQNIDISGEEFQSIKLYKVNNSLFLLPANYSDNIDIYKIIEHYNINKVYSSDFLSRKFTEKYFENKLYETVEYIVLDHHVSALLALKKYLESINGDENRVAVIYKKFNLVFDKEISGAKITLKYFERSLKNHHSFKKLEMLVNYVSDRDTWQFKLPYSKEFNDGLYVEIFSKSYVNAFADLLQEIQSQNLSLNDFIKKYIEYGEALNKLKEIEINNHLKNVHKIKIYNESGDFIEVLACNCSNGLIYSELANRMLDRHGVNVSAVYSLINSDDEPVYKISFRSNDNKSAREYAEFLNGSGHNNAAGAVIKTNQIEFSK